MPNTYTTLESQYTDKNTDTHKVKKLHCYDDIEVNGRIIYIPDKYIQQDFLSYEQMRIYKFVLAMLIDNYLTKNSSNKCTKLGKLDKVAIDKLQTVADNIFSYLMMGKIVGNVNLGILEQDIITKIPHSLFVHHNIMLCEKLEKNE